MPPLVDFIHIATAFHDIERRHAARYFEASAGSRYDERGRAAHFICWDVSGLSLAEGYIFISHHRTAPVDFASRKIFRLAPIIFLGLIRREHDGVSYDAERFYYRHMRHFKRKETRLPRHIAITSQ